MSKRTRQELANLSFGEKLKILEQLRELSREVASFGLRKRPPQDRNGLRKRPPLFES